MKRYYSCLLLVLFFANCTNDQTKNTSSAKDGRKAAIIKEFEEQIKKNPDSVGLRFNFVTALDTLGEYKTALEQLDSMIFHDKGNYALWYKKGQVSQHAGDTASAIDYYNKAVTIYPAPDGLLALANLYAEKRDAKALAVCQKIDEMRLGREYDCYTAFFAGVYFARMGNKDRAIALFDKSIDNIYTFMDAYMEKGYIYYDEKKYDDALTVFKTAVAVSNRFADAYYWQGKCYEAMGKKTDALTKYQQALGLDNGLLDAEAAVKRLQ